ncbi:MAG: glycosyl transferase [Leptospiraceae bacterium]|nr:MAG: glycosyl transferase [Leptospiraceae bacterium]
MKIAVDIRPLSYPGTGNATYLYHILKEVLHISKNYDWKWLFLSNKGIHPIYLDLLSENIELSIESSLFSFNRIGPVWLHKNVPKILQKYKPDLFWSTLFLLPFNFKKRLNIPNILNIHDLSAWIAPETMKLWNQKYLRLFTLNSLLNADEILCLSETTKDLILTIFKDSKEISQKNLHVVYPGIIEPPQERKKPLLMPVENEFFLSVGTLEPRKNFETIIHAYIAAKKENTYLPPLIIAGKPGWQMNETLINLSKNQFKTNNIFFIDSPSNEELFWLYENCSLFLFPSIYEGFGLPILEAAIFKKPQVLSNIEIFKEIGQYLDGITFIENPKNITLWKDAILFFSNERNLESYNKKIKNKKLKVFDYKNSAKNIIKIIQKYN